MKHPKHYDTDEATSKRMSNVHLKGGKEESDLARALWHAGFRYWRNYKRLPGRPDIAIKKYHIAVFVDGEFWHGYDWENRKKKLNRNKEYWIEKIEENIARDKRVDEALIKKGWIPVHLWSKAVSKDLSGCLEIIKKTIDRKTIEKVS